MSRAGRVSEKKKKGLKGGRNKLEKQEVWEKEEKEL